MGYCAQAGGRRQWCWNHLLLLLPVYLYILTCWLVRPLSLGASISLSSLVPASFIFGLVLMRVSRRELTMVLGRLRVEFAVLLLMVLLSLLSLVNSEAPFRAFRILFPCVLPLLLFVQLMAIRSHSAAAMAAVPRIFLFAGLIFSCLPLLLSFVSSGLRASIFAGHRCIGFFENPNQHSIVLASIVPLAIGELVVSQTRKARIGWGLALVVLLYTLVRTGSKTALLVTLAIGLVFYFLINLRSYSPARRILLFGGMAVLALGLVLFGLPAAKMIDPIMAAKLEAIFSGGVGNYATIESRQLLWDEAIEQGRRHWLIGSGAGERVLGVAHAHNLILTYFRGIGLFGAICVALLCVRILWRGLNKGVVVLGHCDSEDKRRWACYVSAIVYVICNQLSDSFGPTTIGALWLIYLPAVISERTPRAGRDLRRASSRPAATAWQPVVEDPNPLLHP